MKNVFARMMALVALAWLIAPTVSPAQDDERDSKISLGLEFNLAASSDVENDQENEIKTTVNTGSFRLMPWIGIMFRPRWESRAGIGMSLSSSSNTIEYEDEALTDFEMHTTQFGWGVEGGMFFYIVDKNMVRFAVGATIPWWMNFQPRVEINGEEQDDVYDSYLSMSTGVDIPIHLDIIPTDRIGVRVGMTLFSLGINVLSTETDASDDVDVTVQAESDLWEYLGYLRISFFILL